MKIRWLGQGGYQLKTANTEILIDPYLSDIVAKTPSGMERMVPAPLDPREIQADAVVCTHNHIDHLDPEAAADMRRDQLFVTTPEGVETLKALGKTDCRAILPGDSTQVGDFKLTAVYAEHPPVQAFGVIAEAEGVKLYFCGDSLFSEKLYATAAHQPDVTVICINGKLGNMTYEEAARTAQAIGARVNIPTHYGMFAANTEDPAKFTALVPNSFVMEHAKEYDLSEILK